MPVYEYTALNDKGKKLRGIIDAQSTVAARQKLRESDIYLIDRGRQRGTARRKRDDHKNGYRSHRSSLP